MRYFVAIALWLLASTLCFAQVPATHAGLGKPASGGGGSFTVTPGPSLVVQTPSFGTTTATFTGCFNSVNFPSGAEVIALVGWSTGNNQPLATVTIGGQSSTFRVGYPATLGGAPAGNGAIAAVSAQMPSAQTDTVVVTTSDAVNGWAKVVVGCIVITNTASTSPTASSGVFGGAPTNQGDPQTPNASVNLPSGGAGIAAQISSVGTAVPTWSTTGNSTITGASGDITSNGTSFQMIVGHSLTSNATWLPSVSGSPAYSFSGGMISLTWAP